MLITKIVNRGIVHGFAFVTAVLVVIIWQVFGSVGLTIRNIWKYYLANVIGLILFCMVFTYEQIFMMSFHYWFEDNKGVIGYSFFIPLIGLLGGWIRNNEIKQRELSNPTEKE